MSPQKTATYTDKVELDAWRQATFVVVSLAALVFLVQRLFGPVFEVVFEICIFYVPAVTIALLYLYFKMKLTAKSQT
ncbi:MAG: hypothetical protein ACE5OV_03440 [Candidatus Bathyarchaeia archaeon]